MAKAKQEEKETKERAPERESAPVEESAPAQENAPEQEGAGNDTEGLAGELEEAKRLSEEYLNLAQRVQADFENFRRRNNAVRAEAFEEGARDFIRTILPVLDNLERALEAPSEDEKLREGVRMVHKSLVEALEKRGVQTISRLGERFDPALENAVLQGDASEGEPGTVCAVLQKGYRMGDTVLRHAMVKVVAE